MFYLLLLCPSPETTWTLCRFNRPKAWYFVVFNPFLIIGQPFNPRIKSSCLVVNQIMSNQSQCSMLYNSHVSSWIPAGVGWAIYGWSRPSHGIQVSRRGVERDARYVHAQRWWFGGTTRMIPELWMVYVSDIRANYNKSSKPIRNRFEKLFVWKLVPLNIRANVCNGWRMSFGILGARKLTVASCCEKFKLNSQSNYCIFQKY